MTGSIIAAILLAIVSTMLAGMADIRMIVYSLTMVLIMIFRPGGIMGSRELSLKIFGKAFGRGNGARAAADTPVVTEDEDAVPTDKEAQ